MARADCSFLFWSTRTSSGVEVALNPSHLWTQVQCCILGGNLTEPQHRLGSRFMMKFLLARESLRYPRSSPPSSAAFGLKFIVMFMLGFYFLVCFFSGMSVTTWGCLEILSVWWWWHSPWRYWQRGRHRVQVLILMRDFGASWGTSKDLGFIMPPFTGAQVLCFIAGSREAWASLLFSPKEDGTALSSVFLKVP